VEASYVFPPPKIRQGEAAYLEIVLSFIPEIFAFKNYQILEQKEYELHGGTSGNHDCLFC
jgi:hypothetical protein